MASQSQALPARPRPAYRWRVHPLRVLLYLLLTIGALAAVIPLVWMILTSFMTRGEVYLRVLLPSHIQFGNYLEAWQEARFSLYFRNSVIVTLVTVFGQLFICTLAAYAFARMEFVGRDVIFMLFLSTMMIPAAVTFIPNFLIIKTLGWYDKLAALTIPFMSSPFSIFLLRQFFAQVPKDLYDAALIDGAGHVRFLFQVVVPLSRAPLMTVATLTFIFAWNELQWPLIATRTPTWRPISVGLYTFISEAGPDTHLMMAGAVIAIIPVLLVYFLAQRQFTESIITSGLKG
ncbi:MAG: carbohydrate ABC transporter permease [Chloroflexi bacterium]|nr:MAG: carbohydrate ABC transporter permease [Chloroflexota bacterium]